MDNDKEDKIPNVVTWLILSDGWPAIRCWFTSALVLDFKVFTDVCQFVETGEYKLMNNGDYLPFSAWGKADWEIIGHIKWDGCINWETNPNCMAHGCGPDMIRRLSNAFTVAYAVAKRYFDLCGEEVPSLPEGIIEWTEIEGQTTPNAITQITNAT